MLILDLQIIANMRSVVPKKKYIFNSPWPQSNSYVDFFFCYTFNNWHHFYFLQEKTTCWKCGTWLACWRVRWWQVPSRGTWTWGSWTVAVIQSFIDSLRPSTGALLGLSGTGSTFSRVSKLILEELLRPMCNLNWRKSDNYIPIGLLIIT